MIENTVNLLITLPIEQMQIAVQQLTDIISEKPTEKEFHHELSRIWKQLMQT